MMSRAASLGNPLLKRDDAAHARAAGRLDVAELQVLDRHVPADHPRLQDVPERIDFHLVFGGEGEGAFGLVEVDGGSRALEIVALGDLFSGLIDGVVHLLKVDSGGDVKRRNGRHRIIVL